MFKRTRKVGLSQDNIEIFNLFLVLLIFKQFKYFFILNTFRFLSKLLDKIDDFEYFDVFINFK